MREGAKVDGSGTRLGVGEVRQESGEKIGDRLGFMNVLEESVLMTE